MKWSKKFLTLVLGFLVISVNYGHSSISDLKQNNISLPDGVDAGGAKPADIDGDGDLDFVIMDFTGVPPFGLPSQRIAWARNDGGSDWTVLPISGSEEGLESFEVADMDGDGDLDVIKKVEVVEFKDIQEGAKAKVELEWTWQAKVK